MPIGNGNRAIGKSCFAWCFSPERDTCRQEIKSGYPARQLAQLAQLASRLIRINLGKI